MAGFSDVNIIQNFLGTTFLYNGSSPEPSGYSFKLPLSAIVDSSNVVWPTSEIVIEMYNGAYRTLASGEWQIYGNSIYVQPTSGLTFPTVTGIVISVYRIGQPGQTYDGAAWNTQTPAGIAASLDYLARGVQRALEGQNRSIQVHPQDSTSYDAFNGRNLHAKNIIPQNPATRVGKVMGFDALGFISLIDAVFTGVALATVGATPGAVSLRDGSGRTQMVDPVAAQDVDTKNARDLADQAVVNGVIFPSGSSYTVIRGGTPTVVVIATTNPYPVTLPAAIGSGYRVRIINGSATGLATGLVSIIPNTGDHIGPLSANVKCYLQNVDQSGWGFKKQFIDLIDDVLGEWVVAGGQFMPEPGSFDAVGSQYFLGKLRHFPPSGPRGIAVTIPSSNSFSSAIQVSGLVGVPSGAKAIRARVAVSPFATGIGNYGMTLILPDVNTATLGASSGLIGSPAFNISGYASTAAQLQPTSSSEVDIPLNGSGQFFIGTANLPVNITIASCIMSLQVVGYYMGD